MALALLLASVAATATPMVVLTLSRDASWFHEAYPEHVDGDGDGMADGGYRDVVIYPGYFHPGLCYRYDDGADRFAPAGWNDGSANQHYCSGALADAFSGNFLNWATMTRMDLLRRALYGGRRVVDTAAATVLERAHLPTDGHGFARTYVGEDVFLLTPFDGHPDVVTDGAGGDGDGQADIGEGITACNTSYAASGNSQTTSAPPVVRFVFGHRPLWDANERWQCTWANERADNINGNVPISSGLDAATSDPADSAALRTPAGERDHVVRVASCEPAFFDENADLENCRGYPDGNRKPAGVLQAYGEDGAIAFGLVTGSWDKNLSGGALRKNVGGMADEINLDTDGTFKPPPATGGIVNTVNLMRVWGYSYGTGNSGSGNGTYFDGVSGDNCGFQLATVTQGDCNAWGNPLSEIHLEAVRYFAQSAARAPTAAFDPADTTYFAGMTDASWANDPLAGLAALPSLHVLVINGGVRSYDHDATASPILGGDTPHALTNAVGDGEGLSSNAYLVGTASGGDDELCTTKTVDALGHAYGPCPFGPTMNGAFHLAGIAHYARVHDMRADLEGTQSIATHALELAPDDPVIAIPVGPAGSAEVVRLAPAYRLITADGGGALVKLAIVRPHTEVDPADRARPGLPNTTPDTHDDIQNGVPYACRVGQAGCTASTAGITGQLAMTIPVAQSGTGIYHGKLYLAWEDSEQGGDYDVDTWGTLDYVVDTNASPATVSVTTATIYESTLGPQLMGFVITGTTEDGFHAYSGVEGANFVDPSGVPGCSNCQVLTASSGRRGPQSHTFTVAGEAADPELASPLYYAAKWGRFEDDNGNAVPDLPIEWDVDAEDGVPDAYFPVASPAGLAAALNGALSRIIGAVPADADGDGQPDEVDPDDDNDGMPDAWEGQFGLDPLDPTDAGDDPDGDGRTSLLEYQQYTDPGLADTRPPAPEQCAGVDIPDGAGLNLVVNGDFEAGNVDFVSDYQYPLDGPTPGFYATLADTTAVHPGVVPFRDHTTTNGLMFVADGATTPDTVMWSQTVAVVPHTCYRFSAWVGSMGQGAPAPRPDFVLNGSSVGTLTPPVHAGTGSGTWVRFDSFWYSAGASSLTLAIIGRQLSDGSNDTVLDDIALVAAAGAAGEPAASVTVPLPPWAQLILVFLVLTATLRTRGWLEPGRGRR